MWALALIAFVSSAHANTFRGREGAYHFELVIKREALTYSSKSKDYDIKLNRCTATMAQALNSYFFANLTAPDTKAITVELDGAKQALRSHLEPALFFTQIDQRVMAIDIRSRETCR